MSFDSGDFIAIQLFFIKSNVRSTSQKDEEPTASQDPPYYSVVITTQSWASQESGWIQTVLSIEYIAKKPFSKAWKIPSAMKILTSLMSS